MISKTIVNGEIPHPTQVASEWSAEPASCILSTTPSGEVLDVLENFVGMGELFQALGLVLLVYGWLGWAGYSSRSQSGQKGKQLLLFGILFLIIGLNYNGFLEVIKYVLEG
jgi:hypothetical protein